MVTSGGTNVLALSTADGLVMVDSGASELGDPLMASLRQLSPGGRVRTVFNTHWHAENTGANDVLRQGGATIVNGVVYVNSGSARGNPGNVLLAFSVDGK